MFCHVILVFYVKFLLGLVSFGIFYVIIIIIIIVIIIIIIIIIRVAQGTNIIFEADETDDALLVDASNAFNTLNSAAALNNIRVLCSLIATYVRVSMGLTDRRKTAKNLADSRKN